MPNSLSIEMLILIVVIVVILFSLLLLILSRYKKCPSDKVMVIYGNVGNNKDGSSRTAKCVHGGASFIWPVVQAYELSASTCRPGSPWAFPPSPASCRTRRSGFWA